MKGHQPTALLAQAREDRREYGFLRTQGFCELDRMWASVLDLTTFDPAPLEHGLRLIRTMNHAVNRPMLSINEAMGFAKEPALVNLELGLDGEGA